MKDAEARPWTALLVATVLLAAVLRFISLQSSLWFDEIVTLVMSARHPIRQIVTEFVGVNVHPLYSVLAHASIETFGESAWALRLPACLFGIASVVMVHACARRVTTRAEAWAATAVLATSYHHIWFSQNARGYTMLGFFTLVTTWILLRPSPHQGRTGVIYGLACAAGIYTHLTMAFVVAGQAAVLLVGHAVRWRPALHQPLRPFVWAWAGTALFSAIAYAPFGAGIAAMARDDTRQVVQVATASWALGEAVRGLLSAGAPAILAIGVLVGLGALGVWRRHPLAFTLLAGPGVVTTTAVLASGEPLRPRFFFFLSGAAAIFVGRGIGAAVAPFASRLGSDPAKAIAGVTAALLIVSAAALPRNYQVPKQDFDGAVRFLDTAASQGKHIAAAGPACLPFQMYYGRRWECLESAADWRAVRHAAGDAPAVYVVHTLSEYIEDSELLHHLRTNCPIIRRFAGTLGGGDLIVCVPRPETER